MLALVSDGFPYYVHLLSNAILWRVFDDPEVVSEIKWKHYIDAINDAIERVHVQLRLPYKKTVLNHPVEYEDILWATADTEWLDRSPSDIYSSYKRETIFTKSQFIDRFSNLKKENFGSIFDS